MAQRPLSPDNKPRRGDAAKVKRWASESAPRKVMARRLGVSAETFNGWLEKDEAFRTAYDEGVEEEHQMLVGALKKQIDKSPTPAIFLLKTRHGYRENDPTDTTARVQVVFQLPGAAPLDQFKGRVIEHEPTKELPHDRADD